MESVAELAAVGGMVNVAEHERQVADQTASRFEQKRWRALLYGAVVLVLAASYYFQVLPQKIDVFFDYFLFLAVATTITPLPIIPAILYAAAMAPPGALGLVLVGVVGAAGTTVAYLLEYAVLGHVLGLRHATRLKDTRLYRWLAGFFHRAPFTALTVAAFLPIPVDGIRLMAIAEGYRRDRFALAAFIGRLPRYVLIAALGQAINWSDVWFYGRRLMSGEVGNGDRPMVLAIAAAAVLLLILVVYLVRRRLGRSSAAAALTVLAVLAIGGGNVDGGNVSTAAAEEERLSVLERFDGAVAGLIDARAQFRQRRWSPIFEDWEHSAGELWYRAPGELVMRYAEPEHQEVIIDTAGVWIYLVRHKQAQRYPFRDDSDRDVSLAILWRPSAELSERYEVRRAAQPPVGEEGGDWLELLPQEEDLARVVTVIYLRLDPASGLSDCILVERVSGERVRLEILEFELNPELDPAVFIFDPPPDIEIIR